MNGEALAKEYEVRDMSTGEFVEDVYVLRPSEDDLAATAMYVYGHLCGLSDDRRRAIVEHPSDIGLRCLIDEVSEPRDGDVIFPSSIKALGGGPQGTVDEMFENALDMNLEILGLLVAYRSKSTSLKAEVMSTT